MSSLLTRNPIAEAIDTIATTAGRPVTVIEEDADGQGVAALARLGLREGDAVVLCDHDAPDAPQVLRDALASPASYVAMMASRRRSEGLLDQLEQEGVPGLDKLHVPAGLNTGGKAPGRSRSRSSPRWWPAPTVATADRWAVRRRWSSKRASRPSAGDRNAQADRGVCRTRCTTRPDLTFVGL